MAAVTSAVVGGLSLANSAYQGRKATKAAGQAAEVASAGQQDSLDYLRSQQALYEPYRMEGLQGVSEFLQGGGPQPMSQEELVAQARQSPIYDAIMGTMDEGEDAIMRNAGAVGKMRSGNVRTALNRNAQDTETNALMSAFQYGANRDDLQRQEHLQGLRFLAGGPDMTGQVTNQMNNLTSTQAQGIMGKAQTRQAANAGFMDTAMGLGGLGLKMHEAGMFSDIRLKQNIKYLGEKNGHKIYSWIWKPCARVLGLKGKANGCLAHEVYEKDYSAIGMVAGFLTIDYEKIGFTPEVSNA